MAWRDPNSSQSAHQLHAREPCALILRKQAGFWKFDYGEDLRALSAKRRCVTKLSTR